MFQWCLMLLPHWNEFDSPRYSACCKWSACTLDGTARAGRSCSASRPLLRTPSGKGHTTGAHLDLGHQQLLVGGKQRYNEKKMFFCFSESRYNVCLIDNMFNTFQVTRACKCRVVMQATVVSYKPHLYTITMAVFSGSFVLTKIVQHLLPKKPVCIFYYQDLTKILALSLAKEPQAPGGGKSWAFVRGVESPKQQSLPKVRMEKHRRLIDLLWSQGLFPTHLRAHALGWSDSQYVRIALAKKTGTVNLPQTPTQSNIIHLSKFDPTLFQPRKKTKPPQITTQKNTPAPIRSGSRIEQQLGFLPQGLLQLFAQRLVGVRAMHLVGEDYGALGELRREGLLEVWKALPRWDEALKQSGGLEGGKVWLLVVWIGLGISRNKLGIL